MARSPDCTKSDCFPGDISKRFTCFYILGLNKALSPTFTLDFAGVPVMLFCFGQIMLNAMALGIFVEKDFVSSSYLVVPGVIWKSSRVGRRLFRWNSAYFERLAYVVADSKDSDIFCTFMP